MAVPALPVRKTLKTINGETKSVILRGDEHFSFYSDDAGVCFKQLPSGLLMQYSQAEKTERENDSESQRRNAADRRAATRATRGALTGKKTGLVILAEFADIKFTVGNREVFEDFFNKPNYTGYDNIGSVHDFFYDQSYQQFDLTFDIVGPVQLPKNRVYYGEHTDKANDKNATQFAIDAIGAAANYIDFSKYDWDKDGYVDQVFVIFAGHNEAEGGPSESIWPHEWSIGDLGLSYNGVKLSTYGCSSELKGASGSNLCGVGTACHEFSHCLGLPDTYDTSTNGNFGMGNWDIMASGNYLGNSCSPMAYSAFERWMCGWLDPIEINTEYSVKDMKALENEPEAYILYNDGNRNEFYLLENRQLPKWGSSLNAHGLMVMHIDYDQTAWHYNHVNTETGHQRMTFIPADGMMMGSNYDGDPFPGTRNVRELTDTSSPAATVYNQNADNTYLMGKPIQNIEETLNGLISFDAMKGVVLPPKDFVADIQPSGAFTLSWQEIAGVPRYELQITEIPGIKENPYESFLLEEDFASSCYASKVNTLNNVAGKLDQYTRSKGWSGSNLYLSPKGLQLGTSAKTGSLKTPSIEAPYSGLTTARLTASAAVAGETAKLTVNLYIGGSYLGNYSLTVKAEQTFTLEVPEKHAPLVFEIVSDKRAYVSYFSIHSGNYTYEDFEKYDASTHAYAENVSSISFTVDKNSYLFEDVKKGCSYLCKVRAVFDDDSHYGKWTSEILVEPDPTGIESVKDDSLDEDVWYDLQGRKVNTNNKRGFFINKHGKYFIE